MNPNKLQIISSDKCLSLRIVNFAIILLRGLSTKLNIHGQKCHKLVNKSQRNFQFHQVATSLLISGFMQLVVYRLVTTC